MEQQKLESAQTVVESKSTGKKRKITVGSVWKSNNCGDFEVVEYNGWDNIVVRFVDTGFEVTVNSSNIKSGKVKDKIRPSVYGVGFIGDGEHLPSVKKKVTIAYDTWIRMLSRCYSYKFVTENQSYKDCAVCDEWHNFQNFAKWFHDNYPKDGAKYSLDKDLAVIGNKVYSPDNCMFVPQSINTFIVDCAANRGSHMIGVCFDINMGFFISQCSNPLTDGRQAYIGRFSTEVEAHLAWRKRKSYYAYELAISQENIEIKNALMNWRSALDNFEIHKMDTGNYYEALCA